MPEDPPAPPAPPPPQDLVRVLLHVFVPIGLGVWLLWVLSDYAVQHRHVLTMGGLGDGVLPGLVSAIVVFGAATSLGTAMVSRLLPKLEGASRLVMAIALGTGTFGTAIFALSFPGWINHITVGAVIVGSCAAGGRTMARDLAAVVRGLRGEPIAPIVLVLLLEGLLLISALCPPNRWDEISYHIPIALRGAELHRYPILGDDFSYFPHLLSCLFTAEVLFGGGAMGARVIHFLFGVSVLGAVYQTTAMLLPGRKWLGWLAVGIAIVEPTFVSLSGAAGVDLAVAFYAVVAMLHLVRDPSGRGILVAGVLGGFGCAATYRGLHAALSLGVAAIAMGQWKKLPHLAAGGFAGAVLFYLRTAIATGNPVYPFAKGIFPSHVPTGFSLLGWSAPDVQNRMLGSGAFGFALHRIGGDGAEVPGWAAPLVLPWEATIHGVSSTGGRFDTDISPLYLVLAPTILLATRAVFRREVRAFFAFALAHSVIWMVGVQCTRYQLSVLFIFAALFPVVTVGLRAGVKGILGVAWAGVLVMYLSALVGQSYRRDALYTFGMISEQNYLASHEDGAFFRQVAQLNAEPPSAGPVLLIGDNRTMYIQRPSLPDFFIDNIGVIMRSSGGTPEGIHALFVKSGIVDILEHRVEATFGLFTNEEIAIWDAFLARYAVKRAQTAYATWYQVKPMAP